MEDGSWKLEAESSKLEARSLPADGRLEARSLRLEAVHTHTHTHTQQGWPMDAGELKIEDWRFKIGAWKCMDCHPFFPRSFQERSA